jgi:hypothetical protein
MNTLTIVLTIVSSAAGIISGLVLYNLTGIREMIGNHAKAIAETNKDITSINAALAVCKQDCMRSMVSKEDWVRSEGYTRQLLEKVSLQLASMQGQIQITEKLPEIIGQIVRQIVAEIRK